VPGLELTNEIIVNSICLMWFAFCWIGYAYYSKNQAEKIPCLATELHNYREFWMRRVMLREIRVGDAALIANLERNVSFLASTAILILAGLLTLFTVSSEIARLVEQIPFSLNSSYEAVQLKTLLLVVIFIYAFFTFTWSMRQYGFCSIVLGGAPMPDEEGVSDKERENYAFYAARVIDLAGMSYNHGLRAYYFALSVLAWFINPYLFILASAFVVAVLYRREFKSRSLRALMQKNSKKERSASALI
jgi:uncharacterized membrane protein